MTRFSKKEVPKIEVMKDDKKIFEIDSAEKIQEATKVIINVED